MIYGETLVETTRKEIELEVAQQTEKRVFAT